MNDKYQGLRPATKAAQALGIVDEVTRAVVPPIHLSTTYLRDPDNQYRTGRVYARPHNPTYEPAEQLLTELEGGADSILFASGMAAATALFLALEPGDHVVAPKVMYWSLRNWLLTFAKRWGLEVDLVETEDAAALAAALKPGRTKLVWIETPSNPLWTVTDIAAAANAAHAAGALLAVDSTVATPVLTRPIEHGADIVMHSATKYLNGHSDVLAGTLTTARADAFWDRVKANRAQLGGILGPVEAWLLLRGMRTLFPRVDVACRSAAYLAERLARSPRVSAVLYPSGPVAARQMAGGFGGMLSIRCAEGEAAAIRCAANTKLWKRATSLGGVESLIEHRASIEGEGTPAPLDLLRLSVGMEHPEDLAADLEAALETPPA